MLKQENVHLWEAFFFQRAGLVVEISDVMDKPRISSMKRWKTGWQAHWEQTSKKKPTE